MLRFRPDRMTVSLVLVMILASVYPCQGRIAEVAGSIATLTVALVFFTIGAKLSRSALVSSLRHWRLHGHILASTFLLFPLLGWLCRPVLEPLVGADLYLGVLFMCALPSTVQSATTLTSIARGNVSAAVCSASASNLAGIVIAPLLIGLLMAQSLAGYSAAQSIQKIALQLLFPFCLGHVLQRWIGGWIDRHHAATRWIDHTSICLVVYTAFSAAVVQGVWQQIWPQALAGIVIIDAVLLVAVLALLTVSARRAGFVKEDEIAIVFCGAKKSLASGIPMAKVLFAGQEVGLMVIPIMIFHQLQLIVCAVLAQRYARRDTITE